MSKLKNSLLGLVVLLVLTGCGNKEATTKSSTTKTNSTEAPVEKVTLKIAAAASLEYAFEEKLIPLYENENKGVTIEGSYDSSGKLQTQIEEGMEADLFFSAAPKQMDVLADEALIDSATVVDLLENKVVLIVPSDNPNDLKTFEDITKAKTVAIGDPESVPAGQYAQESLTTLNLWDSLKDRFSLGTNVTEVLNWVAEGSADAGIVYETDAKTTDQVKIVATAPADSLAKPIVYPIGLLAESKNTKPAQTFLEFLQSKEAAAIFEEYGFTPMK